MNKERTIGKAFFLKYFERIIYQSVTFIVNVILARILGPEYYGVLALLMVFIIFAQILVQTGFNYSLVQSKHVTENSYNSIFTISIIFVTILYILLFTLSPVIEAFYDIEDMSIYIRVLGLMLFPIAYNSIQNAMIVRNLLFRALLISSFLSAAISGIISIYMALSGFGIWALIAQQLLIYTINVFILSFFIKWKPKIAFGFKEVKYHIMFGWKLLVGSIFATLYQESTTIIIGKFYNPINVGFYNKGAQFPKLIAVNLNSSIQSVIFSVMSREQDDKKRVSILLNKTISLVSSILFPALIGLAIISEMLITLLLTNEWIPSVKFVQLMSIFYMIQIITTTNTQAIMSVGRSDIIMYIAIFKSILGILGTIILTLLSIDIIYIVILFVFVQLIHYIFASIISSKLLEFTLFTQYKHVLENATISIIMGYVIYVIPNLTNSLFINLIIKVASGIFIYCLFSIIFKTSSYKSILSIYNERKVKK